MGVRCIVFVVHVVGGAVVLASTAFSVQPVSFFVSFSFVVHAKRERINVMGDLSESGCAPPIDDSLA